MFEQTLRDSEGQGSLAWCSPWAHTESDTTWGLNNKQRVSWHKLTSLSRSISNDRLMAEGRTEGIKPWFLSLTSAYPVPKCSVGLATATAVVVSMVAL